MDDPKHFTIEPPIITKLLTFYKIRPDTNINIANLLVKKTYIEHPKKLPTINGLPFWFQIVK